MCRASQAETSPGGPIHRSWLSAELPLPGVRPIIQGTLARAVAGSIVVAVILSFLLLCLLVLLLVAVVVVVVVVVVGGGSSSGAESVETSTKNHEYDDNGGRRRRRRRRRRRLRPTTTPTRWATDRVLMCCNAVFATDGFPARAGLRQPGCSLDKRGERSSLKKCCSAWFGLAWCVVNVCS